MCKKLICDCDPANIPEQEEPDVPSDDESDHDSDNSYVSDSSSNDDFWDEPDPTIEDCRSDMLIYISSLIHNKGNYCDSFVPEDQDSSQFVTVFNILDGIMTKIDYLNMAIKKIQSVNNTETHKATMNEDSKELLSCTEEQDELKAETSEVSEDDTMTEIPNKDNYDFKESSASDSEIVIDNFQSTVFSNDKETNDMAVDTNCTSTEVINTNIGSITITHENRRRRTVIDWDIHLITASKITDSFQGILMEFRMNEKYISRDHIKILETYVPELDEFYNRNRAVEKFSEPNETLIKFALFLDLNCPIAYDFVIDNYNTPLPCRKDLSKWYLEEVGKPGLTERSFEILKEMASRRRLTCTLKWYIVMLSNSEVDHKYDKLVVLTETDINYRPAPEPGQTFVFELTSIDENWKIPVGFFYADAAPGNTHASFVRACLTQCHEAGVDVVAVTFNTATPAEHLGCSFDDLSNLKTTFKHPACDKDVAAWIDPHMSFKSVYHTLRSKNYLFTAREGRVRWSLIRRLRKLYTNCTLDLEENCSADQLELHNLVAKVASTSAFMSRSLASALALAQKLLLHIFKDTKPTQHFIETFNWLFDTLYSGSNNQVAIDEKSSEIFSKLDKTKAYIIDLFCHEDNGLSKLECNNVHNYLQIPYFMEGPVTTGFIGFLVTMESLKYLFDTLVTKEKRMSRIFTSRFCRNQIKHVTLDKSKSVADHFENLYDELLKNSWLDYDSRRLLRSSLTKGNIRPYNAIKESSDKRAFDDDQSCDCTPKTLSVTCYEKNAKKNMEEYARSLTGVMDVPMRKQIVGYLAGCVAATYAKSLKCEECIDLLLSDKRLWFHKYIANKELTWVCLPSEGLFRVCWEYERAIRRERTATRFREAVFLKLSVRPPWSAHFDRHHPTHPTLLVHAIIEIYTCIRFGKAYQIDAAKCCFSQLSIDLDLITAKIHKKIEQEMCLQVGNFSIVEQLQKGDP